MSVWHMLDICLIWVKTKLKKTWQPIIVYGNKEKKLALVFYASIEGGPSAVSRPPIAVDTLGWLGYNTYFMLLLHVLQFTFAFPTLIQEEFALE